MEVRAAVAVLLALALDASAATNDFTALGPNGGWVDQVVYSQDGSAAYMAAAGGFYRSRDGGVSWTNIKANFLNPPRDVAIDPADATRLYVITPNAPCLYLSSDGGATLNAIATLPADVRQATRIAVSHDGATLYLNSDGHIFSSTDRGQTWAERAALSLDATAQVLKLLVDPGDAATVYASVAIATTDRAGLFVSRDGAATWTQVASGPEETTLTPDLAINPDNPAQVWSARYDGVWVSADRGTHWSQVLSTAMYAVALDPSNPAIVYAGTPFGKVYRSPDAGVSWSDVSGNVASGQNLHLAINPAHTTRLLAGGTAGLSGSVTSGVHWAVQQSGFLATSIDSLSADPSTDRIYVHARVNGVFYTAGGSTVAQPVNNAGLLGLENQPTIDVMSVLAQPGRLFASLTTGLTYSTDGGATWAPTVEPMPATSEAQQLWSMSSAPGASSTLLATTAGPVRRSVDRGASWSGVSGQPANSVAANLIVAPSAPATVYGMFYLPTSQTALLGLYKSLDAGASWAPVNADLAASPTYLLAVDPVDARIAYGNNTDNVAAANRGVLKTVDGGLHWSVLHWDSTNPDSVPFRLAVDPQHPSILYAANDDRIGRSVDGGANWETVRGSGLPLFAVSALLADPHRPENLLVGTSNVGTQQITIAPDLALRASGPPAQIGIGTVASYVITATNLGPFDATGVRVAVQLPAAAQSATATIGSGTGTCAVTAQTAICTFAILRKAASGTVSITAVASVAGAFDATGTVSGEQPDPDLSSNTASSRATAMTLSDLSVTATGSATAAVGDAVSYTLVASNAGPNAAPGGQLTFQLASGLTPGTVSSTEASCTLAAATVSCDLGSLAAAGLASVTVTATAARAGAQASTASVTSGAADPVAANNSAGSTTTVSAAPPASTPPAAASSGGGGAASSGELGVLLSLLVARRVGGARRCARFPRIVAAPSRFRSTP